MYQCSTVQKSEDQRSRHAKKPKHMGACFPIESVMIKDFQSEKKFPYGSFFMHRKSFDHSTFFTALHWHMKDVYLCPFIYPFVKIILTDLWIT